MPRIFYVNWFRKDDDGKFLWPGFGENSRVLEWVFRRCDDEGETVRPPIGCCLRRGELDTDGLDVSDEAMEQLLSVDDDALRAQMPQLEEHLARFGDDLPAEIQGQLKALKQRLS